jgi:predicted transcriptional regulator
MLAIAGNRMADIPELRRIFSFEKSTASRALKRFLCMGFWIHARRSLSFQIR